MAEEALAGRLAGLQEKIRAACARAGRDPGEVRIVAATKNHPPERLRRLHAAGCRAFGENRVQEALPKIADLADLDIEWHFIGHLQRNKARQIPGRFAWLHSLDGADLAEELDRRQAASGGRLACLVEVNVSGEPRKSGIPPAALPSLLDRSSSWKAIDVRGLMTMAPAGAPEPALRRVFGGLRELARRHGLRELSMGMSDDYSVAVEEGATMVRLGRALLGERT